MPPSNLLNQYGENLKTWKRLRFDLIPVDLTKTDLNGSDLSGFNFCRVDLSAANMQHVKLIWATLSKANLNGVNLKSSDLYRASLTDANLQRADLSRANLSRTHALGTNFQGAILTGACLEDWNINSSTNLDEVVCDYIYLKDERQERRPREGYFKPGEFTALFQQLLDTIDLIFQDGIDWQALFQSFQDLRSQYADQDLSIQAIEKKRGGAIVVRVEVAEGADKAAIESSAKELYEIKLTLLEQRYRAELKAKDGQIVAYQEQSANLMKITEMLAASPPMSEGNKYDLRGAQFGGGYVAGNVEGNQYGGVINNYGSNAEDITRLLTALRDQAQTFPTDQKDDANDTLDDLERDLADEQPDQGRIGRRLKRLVALGAAIGTIASGAAAVSGDVSTFTGNVIELTQQLGIPIEQVQLPPSGTP
ncbi:pentapeptide repeat-containing protein [Leptolyngbya cf. ectocarpi LEGE 11479]|uniref:Pentapeptide repeat-containing protein n=1 Tax=Leptolyngbya cf. ectocarpi LEGE 11479 TaxID=1828722 RepID=A0A928ZWE7_LEPEC|nr:pentapeptide repeat-containing protein [Leptolyngbya ectocarpi]MBE9068719.1 pentapeptide repeat-containing protein [Leptolyngbya cf. ectocarpi LEGE 11479]